MAASGAATESEDEERSDRSRTVVDLYGKMESADLRRYPARRHDLRLRVSAVRSGNRRGRERPDRTADRTGAGAVEALRGDRRIVPGKRPQVQRLLHLGRQIRRGQ